MDHVIFPRKANYAARDALSINCHACDPAKVLPPGGEAGDKRRHPDGGKAVYFNEKRKLLDIYLLSLISAYLEGRRLLPPWLQRL